MKPERIVVIADDDEDIRESIAVILRDEGYETRTAGDGREALLTLESLRGTPCILLLDLMMPVMDGFEVLDQLAAAQRLADVHVIVCSASPAVQPLPPGVRQVLLKPLSLEMLLGGLENLCGLDAPPIPEGAALPRVAAAPQE